MNIAFGWQLLHLVHHPSSPGGWAGLVAFVSLFPFVLFDSDVPYFDPRDHAKLKAYAPHTFNLGVEIDRQSRDCGVATGNLVPAEREKQTLGLFHPLSLIHEDDVGLWGKSRRRHQFSVLTFDT